VVGSVWWVVCERKLLWGVGGGIVFVIAVARGEMFVVCSISERGL
jgi:hypothetical protein